MAKAAGCSRAALFRWLAEPAFSQAYREAPGRVVEGTLTALQSAGVAAVTLLRSVIEDEGASVSVRVGAAQSVLELGMKARDAIEIDERLRALDRCWPPKRLGRGRISLLGAMADISEQMRAGLERFSIPCDLKIEMQEKTEGTEITEATEPSIHRLC